jgi:hypothetical protein
MTKFSSCLSSLAFGRTRAGGSFLFQESPGRREAHPGALGGNAVALAEVGDREGDPLIERAAGPGARGF